jgi:release factor glutamine methyltransferase
MATEQDEAWTILRLLQWTTDFFRRRGSDSPRLEAEVLLAAARGSSRLELYTAYDQQPSDEVRQAFRELVRRRGEGMPVAYLVGHKEFFSLSLRVTEAVLIPRPETEHVVLEVIDHVRSLGDRPRLPQIADVGTGSGAIAIAVAKNVARGRIAAIEQSPQALEVARYNVDQHQLGDKIRLLEGDLLEPLLSQPDDVLPLDVVCSNPPYVSQEEYDALDPSVREFEPRDALLAGPRGTEVIERLVPAASRALAPGGRFVVELSPMIAQAVVDLTEQQGDFEDIRLIRDLAGHHRVLSAVRRS